MGRSNGQIGSAVSPDKKVTVADPWIEVKPFISQTFLKGLNEYPAILGGYMAR
jgi:hypothetical protein